MYTALTPGDDAGPGEERSGRAEGSLGIRRAHDAYYDRMIRSAKTYIQENVATVTLESVAEHVHLAPNYLSNLFKLLTGQRFSDYLLETKMRLASDMLSLGDEKIHTISNLLGYQNSNNFARAFKQLRGMSPRDFRNNSRMVN